MGQSESKEVIADGKFEQLQQIATRQGPAAVLQYLKDNVNQWKEEKVLFAVTGRSATGKSMFINKIRDVQPTDEKFAKSGSGNTTKEPTAYQNPQNKRIVFYDLPGVGTMEFKKETYIADMQLRKYDYFFIFFDKVVSEDDYFLVCKLVEMKKPFCLVRSKIDDDLRNAEDDGKRKEEVIPAIREQIKEQISRYEHLKNSDAIFLISSKRKDTGDWENLLHHIEKCLPPPKFETFMYSLPTLTENVIDLKYQTLRKRIKLATLAAACIAAAPVPGLDVVANLALLVEEVVHYINVFGLSKERLEALDGLDRKILNCASFHIQDLPGMDLAKVIIAQLGKYVAIFTIESVADIFLPIIGSIVSAGTSAVFTYRYLSRTLDNFRDDARIVYRFVMDKQDIKL
ncbi:Hypothetical predicted protein [Mytilus galloprovincialis]|uniref:IRG-type G domain-containing protein n=1 Tax=Mytilus galloprovincialis TaxID=29158 RepID=A0A8B6DN12_MYTGA|nr:Hypothetical predicted protein [Mytilus galloprovincialis]